MGLGANYCFLTKNHKIIALKPKSDVVLKYCIHGRCHILTVFMCDTKSICNIKSYSLVKVIVTYIEDEGDKWVDVGLKLFSNFQELL